MLFSNRHLAIPHIGVADYPFELPGEKESFSSQ